ncbi:SCO family protein [Maribrevibacterium harenarium]|uniref:SCO family protein n=1 Tax=Maribrevibacterium harenarium TaxID=2589817 RepID=A0A501X179_9GAMM|nr:SCO family protein [Maribrevibacterium harenarium]TPE54321.1 SCO family protein [Maribrevibacterium harenarium]
MKLKPIVVFPALIAFVLLLSVAIIMIGDNANSNNGRLGGDFTLTSDKGPVSLSDFDDKLKLVFFGYTHCPDICPLSLANVKVAMKQLSEEVVNQTQTIFVSVDPKRDNVEHLARYVGFFDKRFIGVTGTKEEIDKVVKQYGAFYRMVETPDSAMGYTVDHSARIYLIGRDNQIKEYLYHDSKPEEIAAAIQKAL